MKHRIYRLMAYIYMPLIFTLLGYSLAYIALSPVLEMLQAVGGMVIAQEAPNFENGLKSIYDPSARSDNTSQGSDIANGLDQATSDVTVSIQDITFPEYETEYGRLTSNSIGLDAPVYWGDTNRVLKAGAGHYIGSYMPGFGKAMMISGHNTTFFKPLQSIKVEDIITFDTNYGRFTYKVKEVVVLDEKEAASMRKDYLASDYERLILYTCYPFETLVGRKTDRLFVFADKISGPTVK